MLIIDNKKLSPGDIISRKKLVETYNTSNQGGITPSKENKLIFIFSDPNIGEKFGYNDGWKDGVFLYSGRGPKGDMEMTYGNKSIINTLENNFRIFVFSGARGDVTYEGEFSLDKNLPYIEDENEDEDGILRTAILFRLLPNKKAIKTLIPKSKKHIPKKTSCDTVPLEKGNPKKTTSKRKKEEVIIEENEKKLVMQYYDFLIENNLGVLERNKITIQNENTVFTDGWLKEKGLLIEAKSNTTREKIRMAIGQLLDYQRHISPKPKKIAILVPKKPREDLMNLLDSLNIMVIYPKKKDFIHHEKK